MIEQLGAVPERTYFVEDSVGNLKPAAEVKGLNLAHVHWGNKPNPHPSHVTHSFEVVHEVLQMIQAMIVAKPVLAQTQALMAANT
jgi:hypothetical protein